MYHFGQGIPQDRKEALEWYRLAADQGLSEAQFSLGTFYGYGPGIQDLEEAVKWYRFAAEQGDAKAQYNLGSLLSTGEVSQDDVKAHMWLSLAMANGVERAPEKREQVADRMTPSDINRADELAKKWMASNQFPTHPLSDCNDEAVKLMENDEIADSIEMLERCLSVTGDSARTLSVLGGAYLFLGDSSLALQHISEAIQLGRHDYESYFIRGQAHMNLEAYEAAITNFSEALKLKPNFLAYKKRGGCYVVSQKYELAKADLDKAVSVNDSDPEFF